MTAPPLESLVALGAHPDLALADGAPDVRGWEVTSPAFAPLGEVEELLVDVGASCVRYLVVATSADDARRRILLPIGKARIDDALDRIVVVTPSCLDNVPAYDASVALDREYEHRVLAGWDERGGEDHDFYRCPAFARDDFYAAHRQRTQCGRRTGDDPARCDQAAHAPAPLADELGLQLKVVPRDQQ
jgi:hypothetical protein